MAQDYNIEIKRFNNTDYDGLLPANSQKGTTDPTSSTKGLLGQFYFNTSTDPATIWQCVGESGGSYSWKEIIDVDAFSKEETLTPEVAALYGLGPDAVPDDVFELLSGPLKVETGSYVGTGEHGLAIGANANTLHFSAPPRFVAISKQEQTYNNTFLWWPGVTKVTTGATSSLTSTILSVSKDFSWGSTNSAASQMNANGILYFYMAII